jgi:hypothetical protein
VCLCTLALYEDLQDQKGRTAYGLTESELESILAYLLLDEGMPGGENPEFKIRFSDNGPESWTYVLFTDGPDLGHPSAIVARYNKERLEYHIPPLLDDRKYGEPIPFAVSPQLTLAIEWGQKELELFRLYCAGIDTWEGKSVQEWRNWL